MQESLLQSSLLKVELKMSSPSTDKFKSTVPENDKKQRLLELVSMSLHVDASQKHSQLTAAAAATSDGLIRRTLPAKIQKTSPSALKPCD